MTDEPRRHIRFDPTINLGHIGSAGVFLIASLIAYINLDNRVQNQKGDVERVDRDYREADKRIETVFMERVNDQKSLIANVSLTTATNISEIKATMLRIEIELKNKADKPGIR